MKKLFLFSSFIICCFNLQAQKKIEDSITDSYWIKIEDKKNKSLKLPDLKYTPENFYFRLSGDGTKVDIWKDSLNVPQGIVTNYIYKNNRRKTKEDTIISRTILTLEKANTVFELIQKSKILDLPTGEKIEEWNGKHSDGITYGIAFSDKNNYSYKFYWSPSAYNTFPERIQVAHFISEITNVLELEKITQAFRDSLPKNAIYTTDSIQLITVPANAYCWLDYTGNTKMPYGIGYAYLIQKIKTTSLNLGFSVSYKTNLNDSYDFKGRFNKSKILSKNPDKYNDAISLGYRYRKLIFLDPLIIWKNYSIGYHGFIPNLFLFSIGTDFLNTQLNTKAGLSLELEKRFNFFETNVFFKTYYYNGHTINYEYGLRKYIRFKDKWIKGFFVNASYEKFLNYKDFNFSVSFPIDL